LKVHWRLPLAGAAAYLLFVLMTLPADRTADWVKRTSNGLELQLVSGTLFSGKAQRVSIRGLALGPVSWSLRPLPLLLARLEYRVTLSDPEFTGKGRIGTSLGGRLYLHDLRVELKPDALLTRVSSLPVQIAGVVTLRIETANLVDGFPRELSGQMDWAGAQLIEPVALPLGHVEATLQSDGNTLVSQVSGSGETALTGDFSLTPEGVYKLNLLLTPGPSVSPDIVDGLKTFGQSRPGGAYLITDTGRL
jgi:general secretion pathway protein N